MPTNLLEDWVAFRIGEIYLPEAREATQDLGDDAILVGRIKAYSDSGSDIGAFGVVEISAGRFVIVPVDRLRRIDWPVSGE
jgi:hypothetical protein